MLKRFYKIKKAPKVFFHPNIETRTVAYGEDIRRELREWQTYFFSEARAGKNGFRLSKQGNVVGSDYAIGGPLFGKEKPPETSGHGKLAMHGVTYEIAKGGFVLANGSQSELNVGTEIKAWAILSIPGELTNFNAFAVIGKPVGSENMCLALYEMSGVRPSARMIASVAIEYTMNRDSELICFGKHIFVVHNSKLSYYYCNVEKEQLEEVPIGTDGANSEKAWCMGVSGNIALDRAGGVFWLSERDVYGIRIGSPANLLHVALLARELPLGIRADGEELCLYTEDRNSHKQNVIRCMSVNGVYERVAE